MKKRIFFYFCLIAFFLASFGISACGSSQLPHHKKPKGKLKKGARIPCPVKDC